MASVVLKRSSSIDSASGASIGTTAEAKLETKTDIALATWAKLVTEWGAGKFNDPETADATIEEFFARDCVVDATHGCAGLHPTFKSYGYADLKDYWAMIADFEMEGRVRINFVASPRSEGEVWHHFEVEVLAHKATGKRAHATSGVCIVSFDGARISKLVLINQAPATIAAMYSTDPDGTVPQSATLPSFAPALDPKAAAEAMVARWAAGEFNGAETKQAAVEKHVVADCLIDHTSPAMPSLLKAYTGHEGLEAWNSGVVGEQWELSNVDIAMAAGIKAGCVLTYFSCDIKHKATGKEAKGVVSYQENAYNSEGQYVYTRSYWVDPAAVAAIHAA